MKKKIILFALVLVIVIGGVLFWALSNASSLVASYKPELEKMASKAVGSKVELGGLDVSVFPTTKVRVAELKIGTPQDGLNDAAKKALTLKDLDLELSLMGLLKRQLVITKLAIEKPSITLHKTTQGIEIVGLPKRESTHKDRADRRDNRADQQSKPGLPLSLELDSVEIKQGSLTLVDGEKTYVVSPIDFSAGIKLDGVNLYLRNLALNATALNASKISLKIPKMSLTAGKLTIPDASVNLNGEVIKLAADYSLHNKAGTATVNISSLKLKSVLPLLEQTAPVIKEFDLAGLIATDLKLHIKPDDNFVATGKVTISDFEGHKDDLKISGLNTVLSVNASNSSQNLLSEKVSLNLNAAPIAFSLDAKLQSNKLNASLGRIEMFGGKGSLDLALALDQNRPFTSNLSLGGLNIESALASFSSASSQLSGTLNKLELQTSGQLGGPDLLGSLKSTGKLEVKDGSIRGVNLAAQVFKSIKDLPFLSGSLYSSAEESAGNGSALTESDTKIESLTTNFSLANKQLSTPDLKLLSTLFNMDSSGVVRLDGSLDLDTTFLVEANLSERLVKKAKELKGLLNSEGQLVIPLTLSGKIPKVVVLPNLKALLKSAAAKALTDKASDFLKGTLGGKKEGGLKGILGF